MSITSEVDPIDTSNAVEWQSYLSDPTGDVILQSSDNVLFEAHSWTLGKAR
jgi:hypothetical protein